MKTLLLFALTAALSVMASAQRIVYTKVFPGSKPDYVKITIAKSGAATYQEAADEPEPDQVQLDSAATKAIFDLAERLNHFQGKLESGMKVAKTASERPTEATHWSAKAMAQAVGSETRKADHGKPGLARRRRAQAKSRKRERARRCRRTLLKRDRNSS